MLHQNAMALLKQYDIPVERVGTDRSSFYSARTGMAVITWQVNPRTGRMQEVSGIGNGRHLTPPLPKNGKMKVVTAAVLLRQFIQNAFSPRWIIGLVELEAGPDGSHPKLAFSVRAKNLYPDQPIDGGINACKPLDCNVRTPEAVAMGRAAVEGDCPAEILLDWLKEKEFLSEPKVRKRRARKAVAV